MRGATAVGVFTHHQCGISIHTPHAGSDCKQIHLMMAYENFNPHSPCGERPALTYLVCPVISISIHTPHAGSDFAFSFSAAASSVFQSTLPMRGATRKYRIFIPNIRISIHTPHAGSDSKSYRIHIKFKNKIYDIRNKNKL